MFLVVILVAVATCAPVSEVVNNAEQMTDHVDADRHIPLQKRAEEAIIFGNQQNPNRVKKAGPGFHSPTLRDLELDDQSSVLAKLVDDEKNVDEIVDLPTQTAHDESEIAPEFVPPAVSSESTSEEVLVNQSENASEENSETEDNQSTEESEQEVLEKSDESSKEDESENVTEGDLSADDIYADDDESDLEGIDNELPNSNSADIEETEPTFETDEYSNEIFNPYNYLFDHEEPVIDLYNFGFPPTQPEDNTDNVNAAPAEVIDNDASTELNSMAEIKRNRRIKRDLTFGLGDEALYFPDDLDEDGLDGWNRAALEELVDRSSRSGYNLFPEADEVPRAYLDDLYPEEDEAYPEIDSGNEWDNVNIPQEPEYRPVTIDGEEGIFIPIKRQSLSFMPGSRRKRFFYPAFQEPKGHWGAFVARATQKRNYENEYTKLLRLAQALAYNRGYSDEGKYPDILSQDKPASIISSGLGCIDC